MSSNPFDIVSNLLKKKPPIHELKWKIPEARFSAEVKDVENYVGQLRKKARFVKGGEFSDSVFYKQYGENTYAYFLVRVDNKTQQENLLFDGYMIQEEDQLDLEVASAYSIQAHLEKLGYKHAFDRSFTLWCFTAGIVRVNVYSINEFGDFIEVALPATKFVKAREAAENFAFNLFEKLGVKKDEIIPTDINTIQLMQNQQSEQGEGKKLF